MRRLLAKLGFPQAAGLYFDGRSVYVSHLAATPLGAVEQDRFVVPLGAEESEADAVNRALDRLPGGGAALPIVVGVPTEESYLATRPVSAASVSASAKVLLRESLRSASVSVDKMVADVARFRPDKRDVASIAACQRKAIAPLGETLERRRARLAGAEPAPCSLLRWALARDHLGQRAKVVVYIFLSELQALALLAAGGRPIAWRTAPLVPGDEAAGMLTLVRSLVAISKLCGVERPLDVVAVHGRTDLKRLVDAEWIRQQLEVPMQWLEEPRLSGEHIAHGLALGGLDGGDLAFNLAAEFQRPPRLLEIFPWRECLIYAAALLLMAGFLFQQKVQLDDARAAEVSASSGSATASLSQTDLDREKKDLEARVSSVRKFLDSRILWTNYTRELAAHLPDNVYLTSFSGDAAYEKSSGKASAKRALVIKGAVSLPQSGLIPHEIDHLLNTIRQHPQFTADFPIVELADLKQFRRMEDDRQLAMFTVLCLPKDRRKKQSSTGSAP